MTVVIGKRKRREYLTDSKLCQEVEARSSHDSRLKALLRQSFENKFEPLETCSPMSGQDSFLNDDPGPDHDPNEWTGFSDGDEDEDKEVPEAIVFHHQNNRTARGDISKQELKSFMGAKPPTEEIKPRSSSKRRATESQDPEETATDAANLKKDLALERLLQESHLLDPRSSLTPSGRNRHKAMDVRQQALGSKTSVFAQQKMPQAQRKGIVAKATEREEKRRREAKESGIILEKAVKSKTKDLKRERGVGAPSVGKFSRGMLTLSKRDVNIIVGPAKKPKRR
ncbi:pre-rRNA processing and 40S ribosomal subunit assembly [Xanthoria calcicola]